MNKEDKIGALWVNKEKGYMRGTVNDVPIIIFKNGYKNEDKQPDYIIYKREDKTKETPKAASFEAVPTEEGELPF